MSGRSGHRCGVRTPLTRPHLLASLELPIGNAVRRVIVPSDFFVSGPALFRDEPVC